MAVDTATRPASSEGLASRLRITGDGNGIFVVATIVLIGCLIITEATGGDFLTAANLRSILSRSVGLGITAIGQTVAILAGSLDLSVSYMVSLGANMGGEVMAGDPSRVVLGVVAVLAAGGVIGLMNGLMITRLDIHPFMATLAMALLLDGLLRWRFTSFAPEVPDNFAQLGYGLVAGVPIGVILFLAVGGLAAFILRNTAFGSHLYAIGGDRDVARLSGVRVDRTLIWAHVFCSMAAVTTGLYLVARVSTAQTTIGLEGGYDLESIAAAVLGGTALSGGKGRVLGTVAAVVMLAVLDNVFNHLQVNSFLKQVVRGIVLIAAVAAYSIRARAHEVE